MIKLYAVAMVKDEEDVIDHTMYHLVQEGVTGMIIADNMSTDSTRAKIEEAKTRIQSNFDVDIEIREDNEVAYTQDFKMTTMGRDAVAKGADWVIPFDADELWFSQEGTLQEVLTKYDAMGYVTAKPLYTNHSITAFDPVADNPYESMVYKWSMPTNFKTCFKSRPDISISNGNHFVYWNTPQHTRDENPLMDVIEIRHFQWRSKEHFLKKILNAYKACKALPENADLRGGAAWKEHFLVYEDKGIPGLEAMFYDQIYNEELGSLILDKAPYRGDL